MWDVTVPARPAAAKGLDTCWDDLLPANDAARAYRAICTLAKSSDGARFLEKRLSATPAPDGPRAARLIENLDSDVFSERDKASQELEKMGEAVESALHKTRDARPSLETHRRLDRILDKVSAEWLRTQRALEALELAGTPAAKRVLQSLAGGTAEARLTQEAKAALKRWTALQPAPTR